MLFNSPIFLYLFLPFVVVFFSLLRDFLDKKLYFLIFMSFVFYGYWDYRLVPFLMMSILVNYVLAHYAQKKTMLILAIIMNLSVLGFFKYTNFLLESVCLVFSDHCSAHQFNIILPLAISFITFEHICYLVDRYRGTAKIYSLKEYAFYISFFPKLISGPIVRHYEILTPPIFKEMNFEDLSRGAILFLIGLAKKVYIAQELSIISDNSFGQAAKGTLALTDAWFGTLAFSFQLYFDFSSYSDMAIGIALMFGICLPFNFNAPYRALSIQDFWHRWHMTLSRFLRDYVYIPLGGNKYGVPRQCMAIMATMLLGGLWHGAGYNFIIWGAIHGICLVINHLFKYTQLKINFVFSYLLTMFVVIMSWVFFRAQTFPQAMNMLSSLFDVQSIKSANLNYSTLFVVGAALIFSVFGPTSQQIALEKLRPFKIVASLSAIALAAMLFIIGDGGQKEFIYFQF